MGIISRMDVVTHMQRTPLFLIVGSLYVVALFTPATNAAEVTIPHALVKLQQFAEATAREAGPVQEIMVAEGDAVQEGAVLLQLDNTEQRLLLERAKLAFEVAQREVENRVAIQSAERSAKLAEQEYDRARESVKKFPDTISQQELDRLENVAEQAKLAVMKAQHDHALAQLNAQLKAAEVQLAETNLAKRKIVAPLTGTVVRVDVQRGEWLTSGQKLVRIINLNQLRIEGVLDAASAAKLSRQTPITFQPEGSDQRYPGRLHFISPEVDPFTNKVRVLALVDNPQQQLRSGIKGTLCILPATPAEVQP
jgi:RND family efflux transporter MFP subunit